MMSQTMMSQTLMSQTLMSQTLLSETLIGQKRPADDERQDLAVQLILVNCEDKFSSKQFIDIKLVIFIPVAIIIIIFFKIRSYICVHEGQYFDNRQVSQ